MDEREFEIGEEVYLRDFPMGRPLNVYGKVVGYVNPDYYNVMLKSGLNSGQIKKFKSWNLIREKDVRRMENRSRLSLEE